MVTHSIILATSHHNLVIVKKKKKIILKNNPKKSAFEEILVQGLLVMSAAITYGVYPFIQRVSMEISASKISRSRSSC